MPTEKKIIKRTTTVTTEEFEPEQPEGEDFDDLDEDQDAPGRAREAAGQEAVPCRVAGAVASPPA